jgi:hypothetical protein
VSQNRRHQYRVTVELPLRYRLVSGGDPIEGTTFDISAGGLALVTEHELEIPSRIAIELDVEHPPLSARVEGEVLHRQERDGVSFYGVSFRDLSQEQRAQLAKFVFTQAKLLGAGSEPAGRPKSPQAPYRPGAIETYLRTEDIPRGEAAKSFVDATMAAIIQLILEGDDAVANSYPQTDEMLAWHVQQQALRIARERARQAEGGSRAA